MRARVLAWLLGLQEGANGAGKTSTPKQNCGLTLVVDQQMGDMEITRPTSGKRALSAGTVSADNKNTWTIFVYLCGSDLESDGAAAPVDLAEMLNASIGVNVRFVVEIGGTSEWQNDAFDADRLNRFVVQDGDIVDDAYGDYYMTDSARFTIGDDGQIEYW